MTKKLEIIGFNIEGCLAAQAAGANRIELCDSPGEGGTTPSPAFINMARKELEIDLYVMIRPRGGDFLYTDVEFEIMKADVEYCKQAGCDGVVFGILQADGTVDVKRCAELMRIAYPMEATFHRAFDRVKDPHEALDQIIEVGFERILTSGLKPKAMDGIDLLREMVERASDQIIIMPGSGVNSANLTEIANKTNATEFHSSASISHPSKMSYLNEDMQEQLSYTGVNMNEIQKMAQILASL